MNISVADTMEPSAHPSLLPRPRPRPRPRPQPGTRPLDAGKETSETHFTPRCCWGDALEAMFATSTSLASES